MKCGVRQGRRINRRDAAWHQGFLGLEQGGGISCRRARASSAPGGWHPSESRGEARCFLGRRRKGIPGEGAGPDGWGARWLKGRSGGRAGLRQRRRCQAREQGDETFGRQGFDGLAQAARSPLHQGGGATALRSSLASNSQVHGLLPPSRPTDIFRKFALNRRGHPPRFGPGPPALRSWGRSGAGPRPLSPLPALSAAPGFPPG